MTAPGSGAIRVAWGFDAHRLGGDPPVVLGGVRVAEHVGVLATSDGDVAAHAVADAVLGAAALGDLGTYFPSGDPAWGDADSLDLLRRVVALAAGVGVAPSFADVTIVAEAIRVAPHRDAIRHGLARPLNLPMTAVSVKATTTDGAGFLGREEGLAAMAVVTATVTGDVRSE